MSEDGKIMNVIVIPVIANLFINTFNKAFALSNFLFRPIAIMGKDYLGADQRKAQVKEEEEKEIKALDEGDIALLKSYGQGQYTKALKQVETDIQDITKRVNELAGIKESDTGLAPPALWDLAADKQSLQSEQPLQVARCTKIINADSEDPK